MKKRCIFPIALLSLSMAFVAPQVEAMGCLSGAATGAVAGHFLGHHAVLGALGGCVVGHHLAVAKKRENQANAAIADANVTKDPTRLAKDEKVIAKLAREHVKIAEEWMAQHETKQP